MKKESVNVPASIKARLQNIALETNRPFAEVMQYYAIERFLYRLSNSKYADRFILKGALLFTALEIPERRTTLDIDFLAYYDNQVAKIEAVIKDICKISIGLDGLAFDYRTVKGSRIKENADYQGVRIKFTGFIERSRIPMQIDIGFDDIVFPEIKLVEYPAILDLPKARLKGYPFESVISEKFESMIKLGSFNSRMKDFYDVWLLARRFDFDFASLAESIKKTFNHRNTKIPGRRPLFAVEIYDEQSDRNALWKAFLKKNEIENAPKSLAIAANDIEGFLIKPIELINAGLT